MCRADGTEQSRTEPEQSRTAQSRVEWSKAWCGAACTPRLSNYLSIFVHVSPRGKNGHQPFRHSESFYPLKNQQSVRRPAMRREGGCRALTTGPHSTERPGPRGERGHPDKVKNRAVSAGRGSHGGRSGASWGGTVGDRPETNPDRPGSVGRRI